MAAPAGSEAFREVELAPALVEGPDGAEIKSGEAAPGVVCSCFLFFALCLVLSVSPPSDGGTVPALDGGWASPRMVGAPGGLIKAGLEHLGALIA